MGKAVNICPPSSMRSQLYTLEDFSAQTTALRAWQVAPSVLNGIRVKHSAGGKSELTPFVENQLSGLRRAESANDACRQHLSVPGAASALAADCTLARPMHLRSCSYRFESCPRQSEQLMEGLCIRRELASASWQLKRHAGKVGTCGRQPQLGCDKRALQKELSYRFREDRPGPC